MTKKCKTIRIPDSELPEHFTVLLSDSYLFVRESATRDEVRRHKQNLLNPLHGLTVKKGKLMCDGVSFEDKKKKLFEREQLASCL